MTAPHHGVRGDPDRARHAYESLRANALGERNRATRLALFWRGGLSAWLQALSEPGGAAGASERATPASAGEPDAGGPGAQLAAILADVILATGPVGGLGGTP